ncbi:MAG: M1 family metallopeptidase, partial [Thermoanaerobaculia bacterium]
MYRSSTGVAAAALALVLASPALALEAPKKLVDYQIQVTLDPKAKSLDGHETLRWTNDSPDRVPDLKFHLYWNAFRNTRSSFFKESGGQLRGDKADTETGWGHIEVTSMTWDGQDLAKGFRFESPDDGNLDDRTVLSVALPRSVEPGQTIELQIAWKSKVPKAFARAGYARDFFMLGQWFPKIGVYEHAGERRRAVGGWNCHQYHANSEFYADFGDYRVEMTLPDSFVVASAGAKIAEKKSKGNQTLTFEQKNIHDFAWSADPRYIVKESTFDPAKEITPEELSRASKILGRTPTELRHGFHPVKLRYYMQPDHVDQWTRYDDAQRWALVWLGLYAFPYPYDQISILDVPEDATGAGGMEYQTLYTNVTWRFLDRWPTKGIRIQETVGIHEFGHGYFYGMIASNEFEESWLDEGINTFAEFEMMDRRYPFYLGFPFGVGFRSEDFGRGEVASATEFDPIVASAWKFATNGSYARNSYPRTATVINQIRRLVGEEKFWRAFRAYCERWRFDHPTSEDFFDSIQAAVEGQPVAG